MNYHKDEECDSALIRLLDALCSWERATGRRSTVIFIPHVVDDGEVLIAQDGKPQPRLSVKMAYDLALKERDGGFLY